MKVGLAPDLNGVEKRALKTWLVTALAHARLSPGGFGPVGKIAVYVDGQALSVTNDYWNINSGGNGRTLGIGNDNGVTPMALTERIAILGAIISAVELWPELTDQYSAAVSRVLLESYNVAMSGLVQTRAGIATGLAFSADRNQVAAKFGDNWHLPNGEVITPDPAVWTLVE